MKIKKNTQYLSTIFFLLFPFFAAVIIAQDRPVDHLPSVPTNREVSFDFHATMLHLAEPSTVSSTPTRNTYHFHGLPQKRPLIMSVDSRMPFALAGKNWYSQRTGLFYTLHAIPQYQARIFRDMPAQGDSSRSVRTPSYIPGFNLFVTHRSMWGKDSNFKKLGTIKQHHYFMIRGFHHSNGQDQPELTEQGIVNTYNGNFGEGVVFELGAGGYYTKQTNRHDSLTRKRLFFYPGQFKYIFQKQYNAYWRAGYEYHPYITERIRSNPVYDQYDLLGKNILRLQMGFISCPKTTEYGIDRQGNFSLIESHEARERWRVVFNARYIADRKLNTGSIYDLQPVGLGNLGRRMNVDLTFYKKTYGNEFAAWFGQVGFYGSDPYNVYFQQSVLFYRIGIAWSPFKFK